MKKILLLLAFLAPGISVLSQQTQQPPEHTFSITGMSEMEIVPDEIYVNVCLREFTNKEKKKFTIEELESGFLNFVEKTTGTPASDVKMDNQSAAVIALKRKQKDAIIEKTYEVKFKNNEQVTMLFLVQDSLHMTNVYITRYWHSKMDDFKMQLRVNAMTDAKTKATSMLGAVGQKPGPLLYVTEVSPDVLVQDGVGRDYDYRNVRMEDTGYSLSGYAFEKSKSHADTRIFDFSGGSYDYDPVTKTIKLKYWVNTVFAIA